VHAEQALDVRARRADEPALATQRAEGDIACAGQTVPRAGDDDQLVAQERDGLDRGRGARP